VAFEHDCREGHCGSCGFLINECRTAHVVTPPCASPYAVLQGRRLFGRSSQWRARAFPIVRDLVVDRSAFDRIIQAGGYISDRRAAPRRQRNSGREEAADTAFDAPRVSLWRLRGRVSHAAAMLFTSAKVTPLKRCRRASRSATKRTLNMVAAMRSEAFGSCSNHESARPCARRHPAGVHRRLNRDLRRAAFRPRRESLVVHGAPRHPAHEDA